MRTTTMRITNTTINRNFTRSINDVHDRLIKSINKVGSGKAYEAAADNPLAYYEGKKIDGQYSDVMSKLSLVTDVKTVFTSRNWGHVPSRKLYQKPRPGYSISSQTVIMRK